MNIKNQEPRTRRPEPVLGSWFLVLENPLACKLICLEAAHIRVALEPPDQVALGHVDIADIAKQIGVARQDRARRQVELEAFDQYRALLLAGDRAEHRAPQIDALD